MLFSVGILFLLAPLLVAAASSASPSTTSSAPATTHSVQVGADGLVFTPTSTTADVGDIVGTRLNSTSNHSVARADFGSSACIPYELTGAGKVGFWSGFHPMAVVLSNPPTFQVLINDTDPIFFYCSAPGACIEDGMVGVINPNKTETFAMQQAYAKNATLMLSPGEYFPKETAPSTSTTASSTSTTASSTSSSTSTPTSTLTSTPTPTAAVDSSHPVLSGGAIAGVAIGGFAVLLIGAALIYLCGRQKTMGEIIRHSHYAPPPPSYLPTPGHMSMASSTGYPPKVPNLDVDALGFRRFSEAQRSPYDRSAAETESYRSRSPPLDDAREQMIPSLNVSGSPGGTSPARAESPLMRRPVPLSPGMGPLSPMTPTGDRHRDEPVASEIPQPLRVNRASASPPPAGPHELSVESDRGYLPYKSPEFRDGPGT
ncbi:uncharacterized protein PAC_00614 [Phialocephala subalpina]|uniref:Extracellular serine-rich protein n=1 Tax=Phialocephala subalpina TaxID=576137 RepID=A0A1L7WD82_9HELO|nr:uncharacterized protein PAC_00614 [Phialocephala subalpina]